MTVLCIVGPWFTPHDFTTIYQDYTRVPPSLEAYPRADAIDLAVRDAVKRSRLDLAGWEEKDGRVFILPTEGRFIYAYDANSGGCPFRIPRHCNSTEYIKWRMVPFQ